MHMCSWKLFWAFWKKQHVILWRPGFENHKWMQESYNICLKQKLFIFRWSWILKTWWSTGWTLRTNSGHWTRALLKRILFLCQVNLINFNTITQSIDCHTVVGFLRVVGFLCQVNLINFNTITQSIDCHTVVGFLRVVGFPYSFCIMLQLSLGYEIFSCSMSMGHWNLRKALSVDLLNNSDL